MEEQNDDELMPEESERSGNSLMGMVGQEIQRRGIEVRGDYIAFISTASAASSRLPKQYRQHPLLAVSARLQNLDAIALDQSQLYGNQRVRILRPVPIPHQLSKENSRSDMNTDENMDNQPPALHGIIRR